MFPKIVIKDLKNYPIVINDKFHEIAPIAKRIISIKQSDPTASTTALENEIDQIVYALYGLTEEEIQVIERDKIEL